MFNLRVLEWNGEGNRTTLNKEGKGKNKPKGPGRYQCSYLIGRKYNGTFLNLYLDHIVTNN